MEYVIVGNGGAGMRAAQAIRKLDPVGGITILDSEPHRCYYRMMLPDYICGLKKREALYVVGEAFYRENDIDFRPQVTVAGVDTANREVKLAGGGTVPYDRLLISAGARPRDYATPGGDSGGVVALRTLDQADDIVAKAKQAKAAVALGGGLLGVEMARSFNELGLETSYLIRENRFWPQMLDTAGSAIVERRLEEKGIILYKEEGIEEVLGEAGRVTGVRTTTGKVLPAGMVGVAIGVVSNLEFLAGSGIETGTGVVVDQGMRAGVEGVFAAGDIAQTYDPVHREHRVNTSFINALRTGQVAGANMAGGDEKLEGAVTSNLIVIYGIPVASMGTTLAEGEGEGFEVLTGDYPKGDVYKKYVLKDGRLVGAILIGDTGDARVLERLIIARADLGSYREHLFDPGFEWMSVAALLPGA